MAAKTMLEEHNNHADTQVLLRDALNSGSLDAIRNALGSMNDEGAFVGMSEENAKLLADAKARLAGRTVDITVNTSTSTV